MNLENNNRPSSEELVIKNTIASDASTEYGSLNYSDRFLVKAMFGYCSVPDFRPALKVKKKKNSQERFYNKKYVTVAIFFFCRNFPTFFFLIFLSLQDSSKDCTAFVHSHLWPTKNSQGSDLSDPEEDSFHLEDILKALERKTEFPTFLDHNIDALKRMFEMAGSFDRYQSSIMV